MEIADGSIGGPALVAHETDDREVNATWSQ
jgi:hypothetical protein